MIRLDQQIGGRHKERIKKQENSVTKKPSRVAETILEMADDQLKSGLIDEAEHNKIAARHKPEMAELLAISDYSQP